MYELLRYISHVPTLIPHAAMEDTTLGGYTIPKDTQVMKFIITVRNEVAKVMFLQASVCPRGGGGVCLSACWDTTLPEQTPPRADTPQRADTPPQEQTPPPKSRPPKSRHPPRSRPPRDTATAADGTHPTGMHSCFLCIKRIKHSVFH